MDEIEELAAEPVEEIVESVDEIEESIEEITEPVVDEIDESSSLADLESFNEEVDHVIPEGFENEIEESLSLDEFEDIPSDDFDSDSVTEPEPEEEPPIAEVQPAASKIPVSPVKQEASEPSPKVSPEASLKPAPAPVEPAAQTAIVQRAAQSNSFTIPSTLRSELRNILSYMDQLLESLPENKIEEFAKSEYFDSYKKLFKELGLV
jgi:hypothetical protein